MNTFDQIFDTGRAFRLFFDHPDVTDEGRAFAHVDVVVTTDDKDDLTGYRASVSPPRHGLGDQDAGDVEAIRIYDDVRHVRKSAVVMVEPFGDVSDLDVTRDETNEFDATEDE